MSRLRITDEQAKRGYDRYLAMRRRTGSDWAAFREAVKRAAAKRASTTELPRGRGVLLIAELLDIIDRFAPVPGRDRLDPDPVQPRANGATYKQIYEAVLRILRDDSPHAGKAPSVQAREIALTLSRTIAAPAQPGEPGTLAAVRELPAKWRERAKELNALSPSEHTRYELNLAEGQAQACKMLVVELEAALAAERAGGAT